MRLLCLTLFGLVTLWGQAPLRQENGNWVQTVEERVGAEGARVLALTTWGDVSLTGADANGVTYTLRKSVHAYSQAEAARLMASIQGHQAWKESALLLHFECPTPNRIQPTLTVTAPAWLAKAHVKTHGGNIDARGLQGKLVAESGGGRITADAIEGGVHAETMGGEIRLGRVNGMVRCVSGGGNVQVEHAGGEAWFETAGGEIHVTEVTGNAHFSNGGGNIYVGKAGGSVTAHAVHGLIEIMKAGGPVSAETTGGAITVVSARGVKCQSTGGAIKLKEVSGSVHASTTSGNILAWLSKGEAIEDSFLDTGLGDITIYLPSNLAVTISAYNNPSGQAGKIISDFPEIAVRPGQRGYGTLVAEGSLNGGGPLLKISAVGGAIYLRRR